MISTTLVWGNYSRAQFLLMGRVNMIKNVIFPQTNLKIDIIVLISIKLSI